jgi:hypothetical protein
LVMVENKMVADFYLSKKHAAHIIALLS